MEFFFQIHDPTTPNRQGNDRGASYRSAIYYENEAQKSTALETIADVEASGLWPGKVVTEVEPVGQFWEAEPSTRTTWSTIPVATPATSRGPDGCCPNGSQAHHGNRGNLLDRGVAPGGCKMPRPGPRFRALHDG